MTLSEFRAQFSSPFPGADIGTAGLPGFGYDDRTFPGVPRFHPASDMALRPGARGEVVCPCATTATRWWGERGASGTTWLDLIFQGGRWRFAHLRREELDGAARALILQGLPLDKGQVIGPAGNAGLSVGGNGGRHLHAMLMLDPTAETYAVLDERWGRDTWGMDRVWPDLERQRATERWDWWNFHAAGRVDPFTGRECIAVDWHRLIAG